MKGKGSRKKWILIGGGLLVVVLLGVYYGMGGAVPVQMAEASRGRIDAYVEERARTTLPHVFRITMPLEGRIEPITLEAGTPVTQGQVVATLDTADLATLLAETRELIQAMNYTVSAAQEKVQASQAQEDYARWFYEAQEQLFKKKQISQNLVRDAKKSFIESRVGLQADRFSYHAMTSLSALVDLFPSYVNRRLERAVLTSPIDGVVLARHVENERVLSPGMPLLDIGDLGQMEVTADILSDEAVRIRAGNPVQIYGPSIGAHPIQGTVRRVDPQGFTKVSSLGVEQQRVAVKVAIQPGELERLRSQGQDLGAEYRVQVRIITDTREDVVKIPRTALFRGVDNAWEAYVVRKGKARLVTVRVGITNDQEAEITQGLSAGDVVVVAPESSLPSGTKVKKG